MDEEYQANATIISLLTSGFDELDQQYANLLIEHRKLQDARRHLTTLLDTIDAYSSLQLEWENFLERSGLPPCPENDPDESMPREPRCSISIPSDCDDPLRMQAHIITELKKQSSLFKQAIDRLRARLPKGRGIYYMNMQRRILTDPTAMDAWKTFLMIVKMTVDDPIRGITYDHPSRNFEQY